MKIDIQGLMILKFLLVAPKMNTIASLSNFWKDPVNLDRLGLDRLTL